MKSYTWVTFHVNDFPWNTIVSKQKKTSQQSYLSWTKKGPKIATKIKQMDKYSEIWILVNMVTVQYHVAAGFITYGTYRPTSRTWRDGFSNLEFIFKFPLKRLNFMFICLSYVSMSSIPCFPLTAYVIYYWVFGDFVIFLYCDWVQKKFSVKYPLEFILQYKYLHTIKIIV